MPRPRVLKRGIVASIYLDEQLLNEIQKLARLSNMSMCEYVRTVLAEHVKQRELDPGPPSPGKNLSQRFNLRDPVLDKELEDLSRALDSFESEVYSCEYELDKVKQDLERSLSLNGKVHLDFYKLKNISDWVQKLSEKWHRYKRWYYSLKSKAGVEEVYPLGERLVKIKNAIDNAYNTHRELEKKINTYKDRITYRYA
jgi:hypothetical protein